VVGPPLLERVTFGWVGDEVNVIFYPPTCMLPLLLLLCAPFLYIFLVVGENPPQ
jgi:hypothetical protein